MSTGEGICMVCGRPFGPSDPGQAICPGHGGAATANFNNAQPEAGDMEDDMRFDRDQEHAYATDLREELTKATAREAVLRGALETARDHDDNLELTNSPDRLPKSVRRLIDNVLATPSPAAERVMALEAVYRVVHELLALPMTDATRLKPVWDQLVGAVNEVGKGGEACG